MKFRIIEQRSQKLQYEVVAASEEEAVQKWLVTNGEGFPYKDLEEGIASYILDLGGGR